MPSCLELHTLGARSLGLWQYATHHSTKQVLNQQQWSMLVQIETNEMRALDTNLQSIRLAQGSSPLAVYYQVLF